MKSIAAFFCLVGLLIPSSGLLFSYKDPGAATHSIDTGQTLYVLAIGINAYKNKALTLNYARRDAESIVTAVSSGDNLFFKKTEIIPLYDEAATSLDILNALDTLSERIGPKDGFLLFYAGHGSFVDGRFYFVTSENKRLYDRAKLDSNAIYVKTLQEKLQRIKAGKQVIIIDACHSGAATADLATRGNRVEQAMSEIFSTSGTHVLASSASDQYSNESQRLSHGYFSYAVLEGLKGGADISPADGQITVGELKEYVDSEVPRLTKKYTRDVQHPVTASSGDDFPLMVFR